MDNQHLRYLMPFISLFIDLITRTCFYLHFINIGCRIFVKQVPF
ncbi:hypothetical protein Xbed_01487 [Xenorhabdus beddingii]|uniref:Uncharacterized protein n=1 Tax=Xenorhabdus beddingii TaxID=40578 RepID=A0A1Y2SP21_9GAMM|nr:hypothetical protein Xbed_01487 [Xenorhabdus beddingii]